MLAMPDNVQVLGCCWSRMTWPHDWSLFRLAANGLRVLPHVKLVPTVSRHANAQKISFENSLVGKISQEEEYATISPCRRGHTVDTVSNKEERNKP
jgi:hypothetical protein